MQRCIHTTQKDFKLFICLILPKQNPLLQFLVLCGPIEFVMLSLSSKKLPLTHKRRVFLWQTAGLTVLFIIGEGHEWSQFFKDASGLRAG